MKVIYSDQPQINSNDKHSIFLAGPTPRSKDVKSWRPDAIKILEDLKFDGNILYPEYSNGHIIDYTKQVEWEYQGLLLCNAIVFWVPRNMEIMPALTTNVEFGYWMAKDRWKLYYGRPDNAPHTKYLDWLYNHEWNIPLPIDNNLKELLERVI